MIHRMFEAPAQAIGAADFTPLKTALLGTVTPGQLIAVIAGVVGVGMTFFLVWLGIRKLLHAFQNSVENGHLSI